MRVRSRPPGDTPASAGRGGGTDPGQVSASGQMDEPTVGATGGSKDAHAAPEGAPVVAAVEGAGLRQSDGAPHTGVADPDAPVGESTASEPSTAQGGQQLVLVPAVAVPHPPSRAPDDHHAPPRVELRVLGGCTVLVDGAAISGAARQAWEIGVLLAALPPGAASWEKLASILWPGVPPLDREPAVRSIVSKLRRFWRTHLTRTEVDGSPTLAWGDGVE